MKGQVPQARSIRFKSIHRWRRKKKCALTACCCFARFDLLVRAAGGSCILKCCNLVAASVSAVACKSVSCIHKTSRATNSLAASSFLGHLISQYYTQAEVKETYIESHMQLDPYRFCSADIWLEAKVKEGVKKGLVLAGSCRQYLIKIKCGVHVDEKQFSGGGSYIVSRAALGTNGFLF